MDFVTALLVAQKPFFIKSWNLEFSCWKGPHSWFRPIPWFFSRWNILMEIKWLGQSHLAVWCQSQPIVESPDPKPGAHPTTSHTSQQFPQHLRAQKVWSLHGDEPRAKLSNLGEGTEKEGLAGFFEYLGNRDGTMAQLHGAFIAPWRIISELNVPGPLEASSFLIHWHQWEMGVPLSKDTYQRFTFAP